MNPSPEYDPDLHMLSRAQILVYLSTPQLQATTPPLRSNITQEDLDEIMAMMGTNKIDVSTNYQAIRHLPEGGIEYLIFFAIEHKERWVPVCFSTISQMYLFEAPCATREKALERARAWSLVNMDIIPRRINGSPYFNANPYLYENQATIPPLRSSYTQEDRDEILAMLEAGQYDISTYFEAIRHLQGGGIEFLCFWAIEHKNRWIPVCFGTVSHSLLFEAPCASREEALRLAQAWSQVNMDVILRRIDRTPCAIEE